MLAVFLLPTFTRQGLKCQDVFESVRWNASVQRLDLGLYSHPKEVLGTTDRSHANSKDLFVC